MKICHAKAIHICNSLQPMLKPKIAKEYIFANAISRMEKVRKHNRVDGSPHR